MENGQESASDMALEAPVPLRNGLDRFTAANRTTAQRRRLVLRGLAGGLVLLSGLLVLVGHLLMAVLCLLIALACLGGSQWLWHRSCFCGRCGARTKSAFFGPERFWCPACSHLTTSARATLGPAGQFHIVSFLAGQDESGVLQMICMTIFMPFRDGARAVRFACENDQLRIDVVFGKRTYEMVPPPVWFYPRIVRILQAVTGLDPESVNQPQEGYFQFPIDVETIPCSVLIEPTATGGSVEVRFLDARYHVDDPEEGAAEREAAWAEEKASLKAALAAEIASRPADLRLPHQGERFRALRDLEVPIKIWVRLGDGSEMPVNGEDMILPTGTILRLDYEPNPSETSICDLVPERYRRLEKILVTARHREEDDYSRYDVMLSYVQLHQDFAWLGKKPQGWFCHFLRAGRDAGART